MAFQKSEKIAAQKIKDAKKYVYALVGLTILSAVLYFATLGAASGSCNYIILQGSKYNCIYSKALTSNSPSLCGRLPPTTSSGCYAAIAESTLNSSLCTSSSVINESEGSACFLYVANATQNYGLCADALPESRLGCTLDIAYRMRNSAICSSLDNSSQIEDCNGTVQTGSAILSGSSAMCNGLNGTVSNVSLGLVLSKSSASETSGLVEAVYINNSISQRDFCLAVLALNQNNNTYCAEIDNQYFSGVCYQQSSYSQAQRYNTTQTSSCNGNLYCISLLTLSNAVSSDNVSACKSLPAQLSYQCYSKIALIKENFSICKLINNASVQYSCEFQAVYNSTGSG